MMIFGRNHLVLQSLLNYKLGSFSYRNSVVNFMLDGTSIKQAVELGRSGGNCGTTYARCPFTKESLFAAIKGLMADEK
jgi:hypothetical protein